ncbi:hypothetical protein MAGR_32070 [Mycolicibacterium agri]|uniref:Uncharacterized protein n=1 Tax=Mycolicibacterium agri TaxID=36811 RepID=A0A7I9W3J2_MYCAG|nr:hypothetical protein MAGR_32070 [Mycolicibacterium agri]
MYRPRRHSREQRAAATVWGKRRARLSMIARTVSAMVIGGAIPGPAWCRRHPIGTCVYVGAMLCE